MSRTGAFSPRTEAKSRPRAGGPRPTVKAAIAAIASANQRRVDPAQLPEQRTQPDQPRRPVPAGGGSGEENRAASSPRRRLTPGPLETYWRRPCGFVIHAREQARPGTAGCEQLHADQASAGRPAAAAGDHRSGGPETSLSTARYSSKNRSDRDQRAADRSERVQRAAAGKRNHELDPQQGRAAPGKTRVDPVLRAARACVGDGRTGTSRQGAHRPPPQAPG